MTAPPADPVRLALAGARAQRAGYLRARVYPRDTVHLARRCELCHHVALVLRADTLAWTDPLATDAALAPSDALPLLESLASSFAPDASDPRCQCPERARPRFVIPRVCWMRAMLGSGADLVLHGERTADGWTWRRARAPHDGLEVFLDDEPIDAIAQAFDRPFSYRAVWASLLTDAARGSPAVYAHEPGMLFFAAPRVRMNEIDALVANHVRDTPRALRLPVAPAWSTRGRWSLGPEAVLDAMRSGAIVAGAVVNRETLSSLFHALITRAGAMATLDRDGIVVRAGGSELQLPVEIDTLIEQGIRHQLGVAEIAACGADRVLHRAESALALLQHVAAARPGTTFRFDDWNALPIDAHGTAGVPIDLLRQGALDVTVEAFDRRVRYHCDAPASYVDTARVCRCGAAASVATRLRTWSDIEQAIRATPDDPPVVLDVFALEGRNLAAAVLVVRCPDHVRLVRRAEATRWGLDDPARARQRVDAARHDDLVTVLLHASTDGSAVLAAGPDAGSLLLDETWCRAARRAIDRAPVGQGIVRALSPDTALLLNDGADATAVETLVAEAAQLEALEPPARWPFDLARVVAWEGEARGGVRRIETRASPAMPRW